MKKFYIYILICIISISCGKVKSGEDRNSATCNKSIAVTNLNCSIDSISLTFFPGLVYKHPRYQIIIRSDSISAVNEYHIYNCVKMNKPICDEIFNIASQIYTDNVYYESHNHISDTWGTMLLINDRTIIFSDDFCLSEIENFNNHLGKLMQLIIESSPIEIDLYGFA